MAGNFTTALEHEHIAIIPWIKVQVRGYKTLIALSVLYIPPTIIIIFVLKGNAVLLAIMLEAIAFGVTLYTVQRNYRDKTDHIPTWKLLYYQHIKAYRTVRVGTTYYVLKGKEPYYKLKFKELR